MKIRNLKCTNWKNLNCDERVGKLNLITGPNGSGKSARLSAIQFAVSGTTDLGDRPTASIGYCSSDSCEVGLTLDDGFEWSRILEQKGSSATQKVLINGRQTRIEDATARIYEETGAFAPMWDIGKFLSLSDDKRRQFILDLCASSMSSSQPLSAKIRIAWMKEVVGEGALGIICETALVKSLDQLDDSESKELEDKILGRISEGEREAHEKLCKQIFRARVGDDAGTLTAYLEAANRIKNDTRKEIKDLEASATKLAQQRSEIEVVSGKLEDLKHDLARLRSMRDDVVAKMSSESTRSSLIESLRDSIAMGETELEENKEGLRLARDVDVKEIIESANLLEKQVEAGEAYLRQQKNRSDALAQINREIAHVQSLLQGVSPWLEARDLSRSLLAEYPDNFKVQMLANLASKQANDHKADELQERLAVLVVDRDEFEQSTTVGKWTKESIDEARSEAQALKMSAAVADSQVAEWISAIESCEKQLRANRKQLDDLLAVEGTVEMGELTRQKEALEKHIETASQRVEAKIRAQQCESSIQESILRKEDLECDLEASKKLVSAIKAVRDEVMDSLCKPVLDRLRKFLSVGMPGCEPYCEVTDPKGKSVFDIGIIRDGKRISNRTLSGGEGAIFCAGLAYAMTAIASCPLKVLLLEAAELDIESADRVLDALEHVSSELSNVFVATCHETKFVSGGWDIFNTGAVPCES